MTLVHLVDRSRHSRRGAEGDGDEPISYPVHRGVRIGLEGGERFLGLSPVLFGIGDFRNVCCNMVLVLPGRSRKWPFAVRLPMRHGVSAELLLVQDGANAVNPEKIQGATMPYG